MAYRQKIGKWGEDTGAKYLMQKGLQLLARNVRTRYGELDLVFLSQDMVIFVEVKTRTTLAFGQPEESITPQKKTHLSEAAQAYIQLHPELPTTWRIDVLSIYARPGQSQPEIVWFENVVA